jgi:hypothetical protein
MQNFFSAALSEAVSSHIRLSPTRQETLGWLVYLVMRQGTICLWRLAAHVATAAQTASVRRRFYRFFQFVRLDGAVAARMNASDFSLTGADTLLTEGAATHATVPQPFLSRLTPLTGPSFFWKRRG